MKKTKSKKKIVMPTTDAGATVAWLAGLVEAEFRDNVLDTLFKRMQKKGVISWYKNIHGRNDKGVDYLVERPAEFGGATIGIQVKSQRIVRSSDSADTSSIRIVSECEAAMRHEFGLQHGNGRLDNIELWTSAHITEDAEAEFSSAGVAVKVRIKKAPDVAALIEKYCPEYLKKIPDVGLSLYIRSRREPACKTIRLLGAQLNPKDHFLVPKFSRKAAGSAPSVSSVQKNSAKHNAGPTIADILNGKGHALIVGGDLSGKSYLLDRLDYLIAESGGVPVLLSKEQIERLTEIPLEKVVALNLNFFQGEDVLSLVENQVIHILIDDVDSFSSDVQQKLLASDPLKFRVIATSAVWTSTKAELFYISGVDFDQIPAFLRSIDVGLGEKSFVDRAHSFIGRTLVSSGLASNPFTIAIMLNECKGGVSRFSTPTLGRLIERFIELQIGSHDDLSSIDFETKREFLVKLAGSQKRSWSLQEFRRSLGRFLSRKSHPHGLDVFHLELLKSGVFVIKGEEVFWSHPIIMEYFWIKKVLGTGNQDLIVKRLKADVSVSLAAIVGSQLQNAGNIIKILTAELNAVEMPTVRQVIETVRGVAFLESWADGKGEEELLADIENGKTGPDSEGNTQADENPMIEEPIVLGKAEKDLFKKNVEELIQTMMKGRFHIATNMSAVLVNARSTNTGVKEAAVLAILKSNDAFSMVMHKFLLVLYDKSKRKEFFSEWMRLYMSLQFTDQMIGDPFLVNIFKGLMRDKGKSMYVLYLLDLLLGCGEDEVDFVVEKLRKIDRVEVTFALYLRLLGLYYYRYHKEREKRHLRQLMREIRSIHKGLNLPAVPK